ncbi:hypothetical protein FKM82_002128 [Ascaphus truei]
MSCCGEEYQVSEISRQRQWRPLLYRKCTDIPWLVLFFLFWSGLMFITGYALTAGAAERLVFGYDSYGNVCGRRNSPVPNAPFSGQDMTSRKHVFFMNSCNLEIQNFKINSLALCVSSCPQEQLNSLQDVQLFAKSNDSYLCLYKLNYTGYTEHPKASEWCPVLPVPPSKSFPLFNRCVPQNPDCYSRFASVLINVVNEVDFFHRILGGIMAGRENVIGLSILAVALSVIMVLTFRYISTLLVHIFITLVIFGLLCSAQVLSEGQVEYEPLAGIRYMWWYHLVGLIWTSEFFLACQQMIISGATVSWFLNRDKKKVHHPILSSMSLLFWYHLGTAIAGSFLITLVRIPQIILIYLFQLLKKTDNVCTRCTSRCCVCCFWCFEKWLRYLNQNAYTATIINGTHFCTSAKEAYSLMLKNPHYISSLNCSGVFLIFLGKVFVVCFTVFGGLMAFNYHRELHVWVIPLLLVAFFAYLVAHSFLSLFETVVQSLFLCYAVDIATNDGSAEKPYFMEEDLLALIHQTSTETEKLTSKPQLNGDDGTELQLIARAV